MTELGKSIFQMAPPSTLSQEDLKVFKELWTKPSNYPFYLIIGIPSVIFLAIGIILTIIYSNMFFQVYSYQDICSTLGDTCTV